MRALLLIAAVALATLPLASSAASHRSTKRSHHKSRAKRRTRARHRRARRPQYQSHPTVARYKQIQQALKDKGYYDGDVDGKWGPNSVSALQRFQTEQGIENEGKITSLALIGLGLGPKHTHALPPHPPVDPGEVNSKESMLKSAEHP